MRITEYVTETLAKHEAMHDVMHDVIHDGTVLTRRDRSLGMYLDINS